MDDVRGDFLGPPHGTTPAAVKYTYKPVLNLNQHSILLQGDGQPAFC